MSNIFLASMICAVIGISVVIPAISIFVSVTRPKR